MMRFTRFSTLIGALMLAAIYPACAQPTSAVVVASCGTPPSTYSAGANRQVTQDTTGKLCTGATVTGSTITPATKVSTAALAANLVVLGSASHLTSFDVAADSTLSAAAWWVMIYDATTAPVDGAVTPAKCYALPSGATSLAAAFPVPSTFTTGIVIGVSTTGCFTKTASTHAFISGDYQ